MLRCPWWLVKSNSIFRYQLFGIKENVREKFGIGIVLL
jgi:hypothetical protein